MKARAKVYTRLRDTLTGEIIGECDLTPARAKAIVKAYALAGLLVEAVV